MGILTINLMKDVTKNPKYEALSICLSNTPLTRSKNYLDRDLDSNLDCNLDCDPEVVSVYTGHSLFKTTKRITLLFIVQTLFHRNLDNIGIKIAIQIVFTRDKISRSR